MNVLHCWLSKLVPMVRLPMGYMGHWPLAASTPLEVVDQCLWTLGWSSELDKGLEAIVVEDKIPEPAAIVSSQAISCSTAVSR